MDGVSLRRWLCRGSCICRQELLGEGDAELGQRRGRCVCKPGCHQWLKLQPFFEGSVVIAHGKLPSDSPKG